MWGPGCGLLPAMVDWRFFRVLEAVCFTDLRAQSPTGGECGESGVVALVGRVFRLPHLKEREQQRWGNCIALQWLVEFALSTHTYTQTYVRKWHLMRKWNLSGTWYSLRYRHLYSHHPTLKTVINEHTDKDMNKKRRKVNTPDWDDPLEVYKASFRWRSR